MIALFSVNGMKKNKIYFKGRGVGRWKRSGLESSENEAPRVNNRGKYIRRYMLKMGYDNSGIKYHNGSI